MKSKSLNVPLYGTRLHIVVTEDFKQDREEINKKFHQKFEESDTFLGFTERRQGHCVVILNKGRHKQIYKTKWQEELIDTLTHETAHTVNFIFNDKGIKLDSYNDEPQAYLTGWVSKELYKMCR